VICYAATVASLVYTAGFLVNVGVPKSIDTAPVGAVGRAVLIDLGLLGVFALQHSIMARRGFKRLWTRVVPTEIERSTYCLCSAAALSLLMWKWQPLGGTIWHVEAPALRAVLLAINVLGWVLVFSSTFLINHFDLFGLRQVWLHLRGRPYTPVRFTEPAFYRVVRHPLYVGMLLATWATPEMTVAHLFFAAAVAGYILVGIQLEERDLIHEHGTSYAAYRRRVPMLLPRLRGRGAGHAGLEADRTAA